MDRHVYRLVIITIVIIASGINPARQVKHSEARKAFRIRPEERRDINNLLKNPSPFVSRDRLGMEKKNGKPLRDTMY